MARTKASRVRAIIEVDSSLSLTPFIETATDLVTWLDGQDANGVLTTSMLENIERWLAAHFYAHRDQLLSEEEGVEAQGKYQGKFGMHLNSTQYGQTAMILDVTGNLATLNEQGKSGRQKAKMTWLGRAPSDQTDYVDRD